MKNSISTLAFTHRISRQIAILHISLLVIILLYYLFKGFDLEELILLFTALSPIAALYGGIAFSPFNKKKSEEYDEMPNTHIINKLVWVHFAIIGFLVSTKALFPNILNFKEMILMLGIVESYFGAHMGTLLHRIFKE